MDWMKLKSGSDVRGVAVGENAPLTEHVAMCLGMAFARYVAKHVGKPVTQVTIAIGRDSRISGPALLHAAAEGARPRQCTCASSRPVSSRMARL